MVILEQIMGKVNAGEGCERIAKEIRERKEMGNPAPIRKEL